jgi:nicotinate-nucleotide adenylyltransferase
MKIGIYAGTFDPIHAGHIEFAKNAVKQASLDRVIIVAEKSPYRKKPHASWDNRQAMIEHATENIEQVDHDYEFANKLAAQHTMKDMLLNAKTHYGKEHEIWFLVGSDIFEHIAKWKDIISIDQYSGFVVALKHDHTTKWLREKLAKLKNDGKLFNVVLIDHKQAQASSSFIRGAILEGKPYPKETLPSVIDYVESHNIYK